MGGLLSKNSPSAPATAPASQKKAETEASPTSTTNADVAVSAAGLTVEKEETQSKPSAEPADEQAFEAIEAIETITVAETTASATTTTVEAESKDVEIVTSQEETLTEDGDKSIASADIPGKATTEVETVPQNLAAELDQQQPEPEPEFTEVSTDVATELEKKLEELHVVSDAPEADDKLVTGEETEQQPSIISSDTAEAAADTIQESYEVDSASRPIDEKDVAPSAANEQPAVDEFILSDEIAVKLDSESCDVQKED